MPDKKDDFYGKATPITALAFEEQIHHLLQIFDNELTNYYLAQPKRWWWHQFNAQKRANFHHIKMALHGDTYKKNELYQKDSAYYRFEVPSSGEGILCVFKKTRSNLLEEQQKKLLAEQLRELEKFVALLKEKREQVTDGFFYYSEFRAILNKALTPMTLKKIINKPEITSFYFPDFSENLGLHLVLMIRDYIERRKTLEKRTGEVEEMTLDLANIKQCLLAKDDECIEKTTEIQKLKQKVIELEESHKKMDTQLMQIKNTQGENYKRVVSQENKIEQTEEQVRCQQEIFKREIIENEKRIQSLEIVEKTLSEQRNKLVKENDDLKRSLGKEKAALITAQEELLTLRAQLEVLQKENTVLKKENEKLKNTLSTQENEIQRLQFEKEQLEVALVLQQNKTRQLTSEKNSWSSLKEALLAKIEELSIKLSKQHNLSTENKTSLSTFFPGKR